MYCKNCLPETRVVNGTSVLIHVHVIDQEQEAFEEPESLTWQTMPY